MRAMDEFFGFMDKVTLIIIRALYSYENPIVKEMTAHELMRRDDDALNKYQNEPQFHARVEVISAAISNEFDKFRDKITYGI